MSADLITNLFDRPIAFQRSFVRLGIGVTGALMLSQAVYWSKRTGNAQGWFYKTQSDWQEETGLTRSEQETARKKLTKLGIIEEKKQGVPCKTFYKLNTEKLYEALTMQCAGIPQTGLQESSELDCRNPANKLAEIPPTNTENTSENTSEINNNEIESNLISRADSVIQSKSGKHWGTQIDLDSAKHVFDCVSGRTMDSKEPNWAAWANEFRLMREQDERNPEQISQLFKFADGHHFWSTVVLSPANLRKNWGKIAAQFYADRHSGKRDTRTMEERLTDTSWADGL